MKIHVTHFQVIGRGEFPLDMLRYDGCFPTTERDAGLAQAIDIRIPRGINLTHLSTQRNWLPTVGRWESFCWKVDEASITRRIVEGIR